MKTIEFGKGCTRDLIIVSYIQKLSLDGILVQIKLSDGVIHVAEYETN